MAHVTEGLIVVVDEREMLLAVAAAAIKLAGERVICPNPEAQAAMIGMNKALDNLIAWRLHGNEVATVAARTKACEQCGAAIFFAQLPTEKWLPMELDQVAAVDVIPSWRYVVNFDRSHGDQGHVTVTTAPGLSRGLVWVNHMQTCGAGDGPKHNVAAYNRRWQVNCARADKNDDGVLAGLQAMQRQLRDEPMEDE